MITENLKTLEIADYLYSLPETIGINLADQKEILEKNIDFTILKLAEPVAKEVTVKFIDDKEGHEYSIFSFDFDRETKADLIFYRFSETNELFTMDAKRTQDWLIETGESYVPVDLFNKPNGLRDRIKINKIKLI